MSLFMRKLRFHWETTDRLQAPVALVGRVRRAGAPWLALRGALLCTPPSPRVLKCRWGKGAGGAGYPKAPKTLGLFLTKLPEITQPHASPPLCSELTQGGCFASSLGQCGDTPASERGRNSGPRKAPSSKPQKPGSPCHPQGMKARGAVAPSSRAVSQQGPAQA